MDFFLAFQGMRTFRSETARTGIDADYHNIAITKRRAVLRIRSDPGSQGKKYNKSMEFTKRSTFPTVRNSPKIGSKKLESSKNYIISSPDKAQNPRDGVSDRPRNRAPLPRGAGWRRRLRGYAPLYERGRMGDCSLIAIISQYKKTILWCFCPLKHIFLSLSSTNLLFFIAVLPSPPGDPLPGTVAECIVITNTKRLYCGVFVP